MPDTREHRGPHPADAELFAPAMRPRLREAVADYSMLLTKGYAEKSSLKLVGDRFSLTQRQRLAVMRSACSDQQRHGRLERQVSIEALPGQPIAIDGYNLLITIEAALSGGLIFRGRDGCFRDLASIHGTYRKVEETVPAVELIGGFLMEIYNQAGTGPGGRGAGEKKETGPEGHGTAEISPRPSPLQPRPSPAPALWLLDSPVSNSGRLKTLLGRLAREHDWPWEIRLTISPDAELSSPLTVPVGWGLPHRCSSVGRDWWGKPHPTTVNRQLAAIVVSTDSVILDACPRWTNLAAETITRHLPSTTIIDLA